MKSPLFPCAIADDEPGRREEFLPLLMAHTSRCLKDELGTAQFEVLVPREDNSKLLLYEVYQDDAAFEKHFSDGSRSIAFRQLEQQRLNRSITVLNGPPQISHFGPYMRARSSFSSCPSFSRPIVIPLLWVTAHPATTCGSAKYLTCGSQLQALPS